MSKIERHHAYKPEHWRSWSGQERSLYEQQAQQAATEWELEQRIRPLLTPEVAGLVERYVDAARHESLYAADLVCARLKRWLPHLADLIQFAHDPEAHEGYEQYGEMIMPVAEVD